MMNDTDPIARTIRAASPIEDSDLGITTHSPEAEALLALIVRDREGARGRRSPRRTLWSVGLTAAVLVVVAVAFLTVTDGAHPQVAEAGFSFRERANRMVEVRVLNPAAGASEMNRELAEQGLDIHVKLEPVSPSLVGQVTIEGYDASSQAAGAPDFRPLTEGSCWTMGAGWGPCRVGVLVRRNYPYEASIVIGRPARSGEPFEGGSNSAFAPGEALHCSGLINTRVKDALPILEDAGFTQVDWKAAGGSSPVVPEHVPEAFVTDAAPHSSNSISVYVSAEPSDWSGYTEDLDRGCAPGTRNVAT